MTRNILGKIKEDEIEYEISEEGVVNSTYITEHRVVEQSGDGEGRKLKKSRFICNLLYDSGAPVPEVVEYSDDPLYIVFGRLNGTSLDRRDEFSHENYLEATRNAGKALGLIHTQEGFGYGKPDISQNFKAGSHEDWEEFVRDYIQGSLDYVVSDQFQPIVEKASEIIEVDEIPENPKSRIMHLDYTPDNVIINEDLEAHIIDFDGVKYGDPRLDLVYAELIMSKKGDNIADIFRWGYEEAREVQLTTELEENYLALAVMRDARGGEWCLRNDKDVDLDEWSQGLQNTLNSIE